MALAEINKSAMKLVEFFDPPIQVPIKTCVQKYSAPNTFSDAMVYLLNRIWNGVKAIFGRSDWQVASKAILNALSAKAVMAKVLPQNADFRRIIMTQFQTAMPSFQSQSQAPAPTASVRSKEKERLASEMLQEIIDLNNKDSLELVENSLDGEQPKGFLAQLVGLKEGIAQQEEIRGTFSQVFVGDMALTLESARAVMQQTPIEERPEQLAFLGLVGLDPDSFATLVEEYRVPGQ